MAKDIGVSQAVLWKVVEGGQAPPGKLIEVLARWPSVNLPWLFRGEGKLNEADSGQGIPIPIAKQILPGPPDNHQMNLSGEMFSLTANFFRPTRYWHEIQPGDPVLRSSGLRLRVRDLLLMETDPRVFPDKERLDDELCGVNIVVNRAQKLKLGLVHYKPGNEESGPARIEVDTFDLGVDPSEVRRKVTSVEFRGGVRNVETLYRLERSPTTGKLVEIELGQLDLQPNLLLPTIAYEDIVCVCVFMVRRSPAEN
ncbi:MAG: hypothetical protein WCJ35_22785 [Planctomycetota bacterium]